MKRSEQDIYFWGNQHGHGLVIQGKLLEEVTEAADAEGVTPEEFVNDILRRMVDGR